METGNFSLWQGGPWPPKARHQYCKTQSPASGLLSRQQLDDVLGGLMKSSADTSLTPDQVLDERWGSDWWRLAISIAGKSNS